MKTTNKINKENNDNKKGFFAKTRDFLKSAAFAWLIIWTLAVLLTGLVSGWTLRSNDNAKYEANSARIQEDVTAIVKSLK